MKCRKYCFIIIEDENDQSQWPEVMEFLFQSANSPHTPLKESALIIFEYRRLSIQPRFSPFVVVVFVF